MNESLSKMLMHEDAPMMILFGFVTPFLVLLIGVTSGYPWVIA